MSVRDAYLAFDKIQRQRVFVQRVSHWPNGLAYISDEGGVRAWQHENSIDSIGLLFAFRARAERPLLGRSFHVRSSKPNRSSTSLSALMPDIVIKVIHMRIL